MIIVHEIDTEVKSLPQLWGNSHPISIAPWDKYAYIPEVEFTIGFNRKGILLKIKVSEASIRARYDQPNDPVYRDSCFEFFVSPDNDHNYYNFEFNCIGTTFLAYGTPSERKPAPINIVRSITAVSSLGNEPFDERHGDQYWEMDIMIPLTAFFRHEMKSLSGKSMKANFYKCGDELSKPHFLCWKKIDSIVPDFHRPEFFGMLSFE